MHGIGTLQAEAGRREQLAAEAGCLQTGMRDVLVFANLTQFTVPSFVPLSLTFSFQQRSAPLHAPSPSPDLGQKATPSL